MTNEWQYIVATMLRQTAATNNLYRGTLYIQAHHTTPQIKGEIHNGD